MKLPSLILLIGLLFLTSAFGQSGPPPTHLKLGDAAPDFELPDQDSNKIKLSDFRGKKNVVLAFYVLAFTGG